jgi:hypothetical protein
MPVHFGAVPRGAEQLHDRVDRQNGIRRTRRESRPVPHIVFRPEEVDSASGVRPVFGPPAQGNIHIPADPGRISIFDYPVPHDNPQRPAAIETGRIDLNRFSRKDPADRQGFEPSLSEPLLLPRYRDAVLIRQVVERSKRNEQIGSRVKPHGHHASVDQFMEERFTLVRGKPEGFGNLCVG